MMAITTTIYCCNPMCSETSPVKNDSLLSVMSVSQTRVPSSGTDQYIDSFRYSSDEMLNFVGSPAGYMMWYSNPLRRAITR